MIAPGLSSYRLVAGGCGQTEARAREADPRMDRRNGRLMATILIKIALAVILVTVMIVNLKSRTARKTAEIVPTVYSRLRSTAGRTTTSSSSQTPDPMENGQSGTWDDLEKYFTIHSDSNSPKTQGKQVIGDDEDLYLADKTDSADKKDQNGFADLEKGINPDIEVTIEIVRGEHTVYSNEQTSGKDKEKRTTVRTETDSGSNSGGHVVTHHHDSSTVFPTRTKTTSATNIFKTSPERKFVDSVKPTDDDDNSDDETGSGFLDSSVENVYSATTESQDNDLYKQFLNTEVNNCAQWMDCQNQYLQDYISNFQKLPSCPCTYPTTLMSDSKIWDGNKRQFYQWQDASDQKEALRVYRKGASYCIRSKLIPGLVNFMAQNCCYDNQMRLITRGPGAGTPDLVSPEISRALHYKVDKLPWIICKGDWTRYNQVRPPNNVRQCFEIPDATTFYRLVKEARDY